MTLLQKEQESFDRGLEQGLEQGKLLQLISLVNDGLLDIEVASKRAGITVKEIKKRLEEKHQ